MLKPLHHEEGKSIDPEETLTELEYLKDRTDIVRFPLWTFD